MIRKAEVVEPSSGTILAKFEVQDIRRQIKPELWGPPIEHEIKQGGEVWKLSLLGVFENRVFYKRV